MIWSAKRSASAAIVKLGFGPVGPGHHRAVGDVQAGMAEDVAVGVHDALVAVRPIGAPPSGCTVITRRRNHSGLSAKRAAEHARDVARDVCARARSTASERLRASSRGRAGRCAGTCRPSGMSRPMPSSGRPPADSSDGSIRSAMLRRHVGVRRALDPVLDQVASRPRASARAASARRARAGSRPGAAGSPRPAGRSRGPRRRRVGVRASRAVVVITGP